MIEIKMLHGLYSYLGVSYIIGMYYTVRYKMALNKYFYEIPFLSEFHYKIGKMILMFLFLISFISVPVMLIIDVKDYLTGDKNR